MWGPPGNSTGSAWDQNQHPGIQSVDTDAAAYVLNPCHLCVTSDLLSLTAIPPHAWVLDLNEATKHNVCCLQPRQQHGSKQLLFLQVICFAFSISRVIFFK